MTQAASERKTGENTFAASCAPNRWRPDFRRKENATDMDRLIGLAKVAKGKLRVAVGKAIGDAKLKSEGAADKVKGKVRNAVGGTKSTFRDE